MTTRRIFYDFLMLLVVLGLLLLVELPYLDLLMSMVLILIYTYKNQGIKNELGLWWPKSAIKMLIRAAGLATGIVLMSYFVLLPLFETLTRSPLQLGMFEQLQGNTGLLLLSLLIGWLVGGFLEEIIFRAFFISRIIRHIPGWGGMILAILLSSGVFGYLHDYQGPTGQLLTGFVGLALAIIYLWNKQNLWLNIFTHGFVNTLSMLLLYFDVVSPS